MKRSSPTAIYTDYERFVTQAEAAKAVGDIITDMCNVTEARYKEADDNYKAYIRNHHYDEFCMDLEELWWRDKWISLYWKRIRDNFKKGLGIDA